MLKLCRDEDENVLVMNVEKGKRDEGNEDEGCWKEMT